jgi:hypothetical protein
MHHYIILLSDRSYQNGLIGMAEYEERLAVADWLSPSNKVGQDPRARSGDVSNSCEDGELKAIHDGEVGNTTSSGSGEVLGESDRWPRFLFQNKWMFTVGDRDCYPSVPHGHLRSKTNQWPKLNPYTGRVFAYIHQEDPGARLTKAQMKLLWNDSAFVELCIKQVNWYDNFEPEYGFPRARRGKLQFPRWR